MARTLTPDEYQEFGKVLYKQKQYQKALETFTTGIEASVIPSATLYDYRAATHEKLNNFNAAIKDGRETIRLHKKDVRGYLRTASALQKLNKLDTAANIYKYGMKNVPVDNKDFQLLQQLHDKLTRKLSPAKAIDPFTVLPAEIVEMILGYLPFKNVVNCLRVSKGWKNYLIKRPKLWADLDLSGATKPVSRAFIGKAVRYSENTVSRLTVHRFQHTDVLRNIATSCKNLQEVVILDLPLVLADTLIELAQCALNLRKFVIHCRTSIEATTQILRRRPTLEHVEFRNTDETADPPVEPDWKGPFPNLHTFVIDAPPSTGVFGNTFIHSLIAQSPALRSLGVLHWDLGSPHSFSRVQFHDRTLTSLVLKHVSLWAFPRLPSTLKHLHIEPTRPLSLPFREDHGNPSVNRSWENALNSYLPELTHLTLREMLDVTSEFFNVLLYVHAGETAEVRRVEPPPALQHISISGQLGVSTDHARPLFGQTGVLARSLSPCLISVDVSSINTTDDDVEALLQHPTSIQSLNVSSTKITGASIKMLADGLPYLGHLKADNCRNISSRDAVTYAEKKGIAVSCKMSDAFSIGGGRKIRYG